jgi:hypothetical protein
MYITEKQFNRFSELQAKYIGKNKKMITKTEFFDIILDTAEK